jgi:enolase-phosphatase E1
MSEPKLYLLDVEGTVAPVLFVTETLFPYAREHFSSFLREHFSESAVRLDLLALAKECRAETEADAPPCLGDGQESLAYIYWLMDRDRKSTALKSLQGKIWKAGYERGELKSAIFDDVPEAMARWSREARVAIYSSGSADAQALFFRFSNHGDLTAMISGYFDTRIGPKRASASYAAIAEQMKVPPGDVLFFSDVVPELDAAREAGCGTRLVMRPGNAPVGDANRHDAVESFAGEEMGAAEVISRRPKSLSRCGTMCSRAFPQKGSFSHRQTGCAMADPLLFSGSRNKALQRTTAAGCKSEIAVLISES